MTWALASEDQFLLKMSHMRHPEMQTPKHRLWFRICSGLGKEGMYSSPGVQQGHMNPWPLWMAVYLKCVCKQKAIASMLLSTTRVCFLPGWLSLAPVVSGPCFTGSSGQQLPNLQIPSFFLWGVRKNRWQKGTRWEGNLVLLPPEVRRQWGGNRKKKYFKREKLRRRENEN